jgi:hypothetical protein
MQTPGIEPEEKAQGMVEFALVLPILLLVILGIIAFGHLFFVYSSTVSASREAARFGAAVGETGGGLPRFRDCDAIRGVAVQRGLFAGVTNNDSVVAIEYDGGPGTSVYGDCPVGGTGPDVQLGDRIIVTVNIQYQSIVPIISIPSFPLSAVTRRTIVRSLPVGDAPTAEPICPLTWIEMEINGQPAGSQPPTVVGQPVEVFVEVFSDDGTQPENEFSIEVTDSLGTVCTLDAPAGTCVFTYWQVGEYTFTAKYLGDEENCYEPSPPLVETHQVIKADTTTTIAPFSPEPSTQHQPLLVFVTVQANPLGVRLDWEGEQVTVTDGTTTCTAILNTAGQGSCTLPMPTVGLAVITASYPGDENYNPSTATRNHLVEAPTPTFVLTPTISGTPTKTPLPAWCPRTSGGVVFTTGDDLLHFNLNNPGTSATNVTGVRVTWPDGEPVARLSSVRFDVTSANFSRACTHPSGPECLWNSSSGLNPPTQFLNSGVAGWTTRGLTASETKQMRLVFSRDLLNGPYRVEITFDNNCILEVEANRLITN